MPGRRKKSFAGKEVRSTMRRMRRGDTSGSLSRKDEIILCLCAGYCASIIGIISSGVLISRIARSISSKSFTP